MLEMKSTSVLANRLMRYCAQWLPIAGLLWVGVASAQRPAPGPEEIDAMRREFQTLQRQREERGRDNALLPWQTSGSVVFTKPGDTSARVRIVNEMDALRAVITFEPLDGTAAERVATVRTPICIKGEQWIRLAPGRWRIRMVVGQARKGSPMVLPARDVSVTRTMAYDINLDEQIEWQFKRRLTRIEDKIETVALENETQPTPKP